jgi:hypothetical protein
LDECAEVDADYEGYGKAYDLVLGQEVYELGPEAFRRWRRWRSRFGFQKLSDLLKFL